MSAGFGIYIHWPFCESKCPYCDFNSHVGGTIDQARWQAAYLAELDRFAEETGDQTVTSVFFGGGTPSLMPPDTVAAILGRIGERWCLAEDLEVTAEANPSSAEAALFAAFADAGVNRLSIGVQSFDDDALIFLGRRHGAAEALAAIDAARAAVPRYSFDLIYAIPGQSETAWREMLDQAIPLAGDHLSVYQLTIERGTDFHRDRVPGAEENHAARLFDLTQEILSAAGLNAYEISNHARPGGACRHNLTYWRGGSYAGIGPGAHSRLRLGAQTFAEHEVRLPDDWLSAVEQSGTGAHKRTALSAGERADEVILMGLRLIDGLSAEDFLNATGMPLFDYVDGTRLWALIDGGFLEDDRGRLAATSEGRQRLNAVLGHLLA